MGGGGRGRAATPRGIPWLTVALVLSGLAPWALVLRDEARAAAEGATAAPTADVVGAPGAAGTPAEPTTTSVHDTLVPRWGRIERLAIRLEPPAGDISADVCTTMPRWHTTPAGLDRAALAARLDAAQGRALAEGSRCGGGRCEIAPPLDLLGKLSRAQRSSLYEEVLASGEDPLFPIFRRRAVDADLWTRNAGLAPATVQALDELTFQRGDLAFFTDLALLCSRVPSVAERSRLIAGLARTAGLVVRLHVDASSDLDALVAYWGRGREAEVRTLLGSLARSPGGARIDVTHLLPNHARERLYTYLKAGEPAYDCHYTSLNFDAERPDLRMLDARTVMATIASDYREVETPEPEFGDVLAFADANGSVLHSAVHIVEDIVFTKNGKGNLNPWVLSTRAEVQAIYFRTAKVRVFRRR